MLKYHPDRQQDVVVMDELNRMSRLMTCCRQAERTFSTQELDWLTEELYLKARALESRDWRLESKGLSPIVVDRQRLTQAVMNLVQMRFATPTMALLSWLLSQR